MHPECIADLDGVWCVCALGLWPEVLNHDLLILHTCAATAAAATARWATALIITGSVMLMSFCTFAMKAAYQMWGADGSGPGGAHGSMHTPHASAATPLLLGLDDAGSAGVAASTLEHMYPESAGMFVVEARVNNCSRPHAAEQYWFTRASFCFMSISAHLN